MNDLIERLHGLGEASVAPVSDDIVRSDLLRGRRVMHRRRLRVGVVALAAAGVIGAGAVTGVATLGKGGGIGFATLEADDPPMGAPGQAQQGAASAPRIELVSYTGEQQPGFVVEKVPEGFVLQGATAFNLSIARPADKSDVSDFEDKLVVMLESRSASGMPKGRAVDVGGLKGWLQTSDDGTQTLTYEDGKFRVVVQAWGSLALSPDQIVEFAEGVGVTSEALAPLG